MNTASEATAAGKPGVVIIGAGHAGVECAFSLRAAGYTLPITLLSAESCTPYQRPPLSKGFLAGDMAPERLPLRVPHVYADQKIELLCGESAQQLDLANNTITTSQGRRLPFSACVFATGAAARTLPELTGPGVYAIRTQDDSKALHAVLKAGSRVIVVGGGYLGLEVAGTATKLGAQVTVLEYGPGLMSGKVSGYAAKRMAELHRGKGTTLMCDARVSRWESLPGKRWRAHLADGSTCDADVVLVSVGAVPDTTLAQDAGIACDGGIVVDAQFATSAPGVYAIGDCASQHRPQLGRNARIESVQHALDSARIAANAVAGKPPVTPRTSTFWSEQHGCRLQMAGIVDPAADVHDVITETAKGWLVERYQGDILAAVEALDSPLEFIKSMKLIGTSGQPAGGAGA